MKILFVCLGNICRSPIAEGVFQSKSKSLGLNWIMASAGTANYHTDNPPHHLSQKVCQNNNIDISSQRAAHFHKQMLKEYDIIFALDQQNLKDLQSLTNDVSQLSKIKLLTSIIPEYAIQNVPDPYYGDFTDYENVFKIINELCEQFFKEPSFQS